MLACLYVLWCLNVLSSITKHLLFNSIEFKWIQYHKLNEANSQRTSQSASQPAKKSLWHKNENQFWFFSLFFVFAHSTFNLFSALSFCLFVLYTLIFNGVSENHLIAFTLFFLLTSWYVCFFCLCCWMTTNYLKLKSVVIIRFVVL